MAVPTGDYVAELRVDLAPFFEAARGSVEVRLVDPGPGALDRCLARLRSEDPHARFEAMEELERFRDDGERVVPVLVSLLDDPELRTGALYALMRFPERAAPHLNRVLTIVLRGEMPEQVAAVYVVGEVAPDTPIVRKVLAWAARKGKERLREAAEAALRRIGQR